MILYPLLFPLEIRIPLFPCASEGEYDTFSSGCEVGWAKDDATRQP